MNPSKKEETVKVCVRCRPPLQREQSGNLQECLVVDEHTNEIIINKEKAYQYDKVFMQNSNQREIYSFAVEHIVQNCFEGYNGTVFAYGQTASGKTYTMGGNEHVEDTQSEEDLGVIPRALEQIYSIADELSRKGSEVTVDIGYLEVYNEEIHDLLCPETLPKDLAVREGPDGAVAVAGARELRCGSLAEAAAALARGHLARATGATLLNRASSRSHAVVTLRVAHRPADLRASGLVTRAKLHLVDLAGSERAKRSGATGRRFREGVGINQGLLALGKVINALAAAARGGGGGGGAAAAHVPYRESKLSRLLQDSLGGNARTVMIACVSPCPADLQETVSTLRYAQRARAVRNRPHINLAQISTPAGGEGARPPPPPPPGGLGHELELQDLRRQVASLESRLAAAAARDGGAPSPSPPPAAGGGQEGTGATAMTAAAGAWAEVAAAAKAVLRGAQRQQLALAACTEGEEAAPAAGGLDAAGKANVQHILKLAQKWGNSFKQSHAAGVDLRASLVGLGQTSSMRIVELEHNLQATRGALADARAALGEARADLRRDEEIFEQKVAELRGYYARMVELHQQNQELTSRAEAAEAQAAAAMAAAAQKTGMVAREEGGKTSALASLDSDRGKHYNSQQSMAKEEYYRQRQRDEERLEALAAAAAARRAALAALAAGAREAGALEARYRRQRAALGARAAALRSEVAAEEEGSGGGGGGAAAAALAAAEAELAALAAQGGRGGEAERVARLRAEGRRRAAALQGELDGLHREEEGLRARMREAEARYLRQEGAGGGGGGATAAGAPVTGAPAPAPAPAPLPSPGGARMPGGGRRARSRSSGREGEEGAPPAPPGTLRQARLKKSTEGDAASRQAWSLVAAIQEQGGGGGGEAGAGGGGPARPPPAPPPAAARAWARGWARRAAAAAAAAGRLRGLRARSARLRLLLRGGARHGDGGGEEPPAAPKTADSDEEDHIEGIEAELAFNRTAISGLCEELGIGAEDSVPTEEDVMMKMADEVNQAPRIAKDNLVLSCLMELAAAAAAADAARTAQRRAEAEGAEAARRAQGLAATLRRSAAVAVAAPLAAAPAAAAGAGGGVGGRWAAGAGEQGEEEEGPGQHAEYEAKIKFLLGKIKDYEESSMHSPSTNSSSGGMPSSFVQRQDRRVQELTEINKKLRSQLQELLKKDIATTASSSQMQQGSSLALEEAEANGGTQELTFITEKFRRSIRHSQMQKAEGRPPSPSPRQSKRYSDNNGFNSHSAPTQSVERSINDTAAGASGNYSYNSRETTQMELLLKRKERELQQVRKELSNLKEFLQRRDVPVRHVRVSSKNIVEIPPILSNNGGSGPCSAESTSNIINNDGGNHHNKGK